MSVGHLEERVCSDRQLRNGIQTENMRSAQSTYVIGRSAHADIVIVDATVSRLHAELVRGRDRTWYLTDQGSTGGTFLWSAGKWVPVKQDYVIPGDRLKFGAFECSLEDLLQRIPPDVVMESDPQETGSAIRDDRPRGPVRRDPSTGDLISAKDEYS